MRYEGNIYRPPSEAYSLLIQVTIGCSHNQCTFCNMFRGKKFRLRDEVEVMEDLETARRTYRNVDRIFLCDGDALCLSTDKLVRILEAIKRLFPECERVSVYGTPQDVLRKKPEDLELLFSKGLDMVYIGAETGSDKVLVDINKGATRKQIIDAIRKIKDAGMKASVTFISGLAGQDGWEDHAIETGTMISATEPDYVGILTLLIEPGTPLYKDWKDGKFKPLDPAQVVLETELMLEHCNVTKPCVFRSNHPSNYVTLKGQLPEDRDAMLEQLRYARETRGIIKSGKFRSL